MILRVPAADRVLVILMQQQPLLLAGPVLFTAHQDQAAVQLLAIDVSVQLSGCHRGGWVFGGVWFPRAAVPPDHIAPAVLPGRDHALEVDVLKGMVLDVDRGALGFRVAASRCMS